MAAPPPLELVLPPSADEGAIAEFVADRFEVAEDGGGRSDHVAYDTADRRLRDAGLRADVERTRSGSRFVLSEPGARPLAEPVARRARYLLADLPEQIGARLGGVIDVRALLPLMRLRTTSRALRVLDGRGKTVVRITLERATAQTLEHPAKGARPHSEVELAPRLRVAGVLGYPKPLARVAGALRDELGLHEADRDVLDEAAEALGIDPAGIQTKIDVALLPDQRSDHAAVAVCVALAHVAETNVAGVCEDLDPEFLHDLRVSVRRTRSVLRELRKVFSPLELEHVRDELKWVQTATGPVRDLDVQLEEWPALVAELAADQRADVEPVHALLRRRRATALRRLRADLRSERFERVWQQWSELLASDLGPEDARPDAARPVSAVTGRRIRRVYRRMVRMGEAIDESSPSEDLHDLRKRGKELRYLLELFGRLWPEEVERPMVKSLKGLQDVLGRHEDRHVQIEQLRALAPQISGRRDGARAVLALGMLTERLAADQAMARANFAARFAAFAAPEQRKLVDRTFRVKRARAS